MTLGKSLSLYCLWNRTVALSYLAKNFEDEYTERGLHCYNEIQIHSQSMMNFVWDMKLRRKNPCSFLLLSGEESREETWAKQTVWDLEIASGLQVPNPVIITTFLTRGRSRGERSLKDRPDDVMVGVLWQQLILQNCWPVGDQTSREIPPQM